MKGKGLFVKELLEKSIKELVAMRKTIQAELYALTMKSSVRGLKETHLITPLRKKIARINTILKSKIIENNDNNRK